MTTYDNRKNKPNEAEKVLQKFANKKEKLSLNEVEYTLNGKTFIIKKWKHLDTLARLPEFADTWYGQSLANMSEQEWRDELAEPQEVSNAGEYALLFLNNLRNIEFQDYLKQHLDNVFLKGSKEPINLDEDLDSPLEILELFIKVSSVNFLMQLSQTISLIPSLIQVQEVESKGQ